MNFKKLVKIFLTGHMGYVGSVLTEALVKKNFEVTGCDVGYYPFNFTQQANTSIKVLKKDIRNLTKKDVKGHDAILHLAALSNDPLGELYPLLTNEINYLATLKLAKLAKESGVERFVFSSSCSSYGINEETVDENSPLDPLTSYAKSKVASELELRKLADEKFCPVIMRSATAYGLSPNFRFDLVVNNFTGAAFTTGSVKILSDGTPWRPLIHVEDMSNAFVQVLESETEKINGQIFNVGTNEDNYRVKEIAQFVEDIVPDSKIDYAKNADKNSRSYKVNFNKIREQIGFRTKWKLKDGIKNIYEELKKRRLTEKDFNDKKFYRVKYLKSLMEKGLLDEKLRV